MFIVAGLPPSLNNRAASVLSECSPGAAKVVALPSAQQDGPLYPERLVSSIVRGVGGFAVRRRTHGPDDLTAPSSITLMYVPASDDVRLLRCLDFAVFPVALNELAARDGRGQQLRHSFVAVEAAFARVLDTAGSSKRSFDIIRERINRPHDSEALLLPPRNFVVHGNVRVAALFEGFQRGERPWSDRFAELQLLPFTQDNLPRLPLGQTRRAFRDHRNLVFLTAHPTAYDGKAREVEVETSDNEVLNRMKGLYRFGAALPNGFHHDVQLEHGRDLGGTEFECAEMGPIQADGSYVNIYANDFVRGDKRVKK